MRGIAHRRIDAGETHERVGDHRQQRIEKECHQRREKADTRHPQSGRAGDMQGDPAEQRDHDAEERQRRNGLEHVEQPEHRAAQRPDAVEQDAERQPDRERHEKRAEGQHQMLARGTGEKIGARRIFGHHRGLGEHARGKHGSDGEDRPAEKGPTRPARQVQAAQRVGQGQREGEEQEPEPRRGGDARHLVALRHQRAGRGSEHENGAEAAERPEDQPHPQGQPGEQPRHQQCREPRRQRPSDAPGQCLAHTQPRAGDNPVGLELHQRERQRTQPDQGKQDPRAAERLPGAPLRDRDHGHVAAPSLGI